LDIAKTAALETIGLNASLCCGNALLFHEFRPPLSRSRFMASWFPSEVLPEELLRSRFASVIGMKIRAVTTSVRLTINIHLVLVFIFFLRSVGAASDLWWSWVC
jgi:hypothetical protein